MAFQFPANPTLLETVVNPITGSTYQWRDDLSKWILTRQTTEISEIIWEGDSPPNPVGDYKLATGAATHPPGRGPSRHSSAKPATAP